MVPQGWLTETELVGRDEAYALEQLLYHEARLLDAERWRDWLALLAPDVHYWLPTRENRYRRDPRGVAPRREDAALFDDRLGDLEDRIRRLETGLVWGEDPPGRIRRLITGVSAFAVDTPDVRRVYSHFLVYRNRRQDEVAMFAGARRDTWRSTADGWRLVAREVLLDQHVVLDKNLYLVF
jgi:3-phenylpropionate/cinnamic acid dioxygenase small subunit